LVANGKATVVIKCHCRETQNVKTLQHANKIGTLAEIAARSAMHAGSTSLFASHFYSLQTAIHFIALHTSHCSCFSLH